MYFQTKNKMKTGSNVMVPIFVHFWYPDSHAIRPSVEGNIFILVCISQSTSVQD